MIGGEYFIELKPVEDSLLYSLASVCPEHAFFSSGRDAIYGLLNKLSSQRIWIPDLICKSVFTAIRQSGKEIHFYPINDQLLPESGWLSELQSGDIVFINHLFGIMPAALLDALAKTDALVISDLTHKLYNLTGWQTVASQSTFILSSLRKTMAVPDGAFVASRKHEIAEPQQPASDEFWAQRAAALLSRGGSANRGFMSDENFHLFKKAELWADANPAAARKISDCSRGLLSTMSENDWEAARKQTHHNQAILATHLSDRIACPQVRATGTLPEIAVSSFFPILLEPAQRDKLKAVLAEQRIYCPIHWDTTFLKTEHPLSQRILSIPCDRRYNDRDMTYIAKLVIAHT